MPSSPWSKSPPDLIARFDAALPGHPGLVRKPMFGYPAAFDPSVLLPARRHEM